MNTYNYKFLYPSCVSSAVTTGRGYLICCCLSVLDLNPLASMIRLVGPLSVDAVSQSVPPLLYRLTNTEILITN